MLVSSKNTQDREETIAKVFEKVDTFWTYHSSTCILEEAQSNIELHCKEAQSNLLGSSTSSTLPVHADQPCLCIHLDLGFAGSSTVHCRQLNLTLQEAQPCQCMQIN